MKTRKIKEENGKITDPRRQYGYLRHNLEAIPGIAFCAMLGGVDDYTGMELFGNKHLKWFSKHFHLPHGITDAMGHQKQIAAKIVEKQAGCCLALKQKHPDLHDDVRFYFENDPAARFFRRRAEKDRGCVPKKVSDFAQSVLPCSLPSAPFHAIMKD